MITSSLMKSFLFSGTMLLQLINHSSGIPWGKFGAVPRVKSTLNPHSVETEVGVFGRMNNPETQTAPTVENYKNMYKKPFENNRLNDKRATPGKRIPSHKSVDNQNEELLHLFEIAMKSKEFGEKLAEKYFGPGGKKGFRWGYRQGKRIHAAARKCEHLIEELTNDSSCPKPLQTSSPLPDSDIVKCIVEVTNLGYGTCLPPKESRQYPPEANCTLDYPMMNSNDCNP